MIETILGIAICVVLLLIIYASMKINEWAEEVEREEDWEDFIKQYEEVNGELKPGEYKHIGDKDE